MPMAAAAEQTPPDDKPTEQSATIAEEGGDGLVETLKKSGYTIFAELLEITGVANELEEDKPFTCFAPKNEAFNLKVFERIKQTPKDEQLLDLLRYHIIQGDLPRDIILISRRERTLNGKFLMFWVSKEEISVNNDSKLMEADIKAKGGLIHGVAKILRSDVDGALP